MSEFAPHGPSPESEQRPVPPDALTLPLKGNPWLDFDLQAKQIVLHHTQDQPGKPIESGYRAILELAKEQNTDPEQVIASVIATLSQEREEGLAQIKTLDDATFDQLSRQYGKRLGLFLGNERIWVLPGARDSKKPSLAGIFWGDWFQEGRPVIALKGFQPGGEFTFNDTRNKRAAQASRLAVERIEKELGIVSRYEVDGYYGSVDDNTWHFKLPSVQEELISLDRSAYVEIAGGYRAITTFRPGELAFGDELLPEKHTLEFPDPKIGSECERIYNEEMQTLKQKKQS